MEYILNSNEHKGTNNCLRKISLRSFTYYNYFENLSNNFSIGITYKNKSILITFQKGRYNVSDINQIIHDTIQEKFNITETPITISSDVNRYAISIIIKKDWQVRLNISFMNLFGFSKEILTEGYNRNDRVPNIDKVKFLKIYCDLVDNREDNEFLTNVFITGNISQ